MAGYIGGKAVNLSTSGADISGTANLDTVDVDGAVDFASTTAHAGNASFADNAKAIFGDGSDLQLYHTGSVSVISEQGTGDLNIQTNGANIALLGNGGSEYMANFASDGAAKLFFNNGEKIATTNTGVDVTGTLTTDGLTVDGNAILTGNQPLTVNTTGNNQIRLQGNGTAFGQAYGATGIDWGFTDDSGSLTRMVIDSSGNVGINNSGPNEKLHINGNIHLELGSNSPSNQATLGDIKFGARADNTVTAIIRAIAGDNTNGTDGQLTFFTADNTASAAAAERMRIDSSGNLLVGKTGNLASARTLVAGTKSGTNGTNGQLVVLDEQAYSTTDNGGGISFAGNFYSGGQVVFATVQGVKENNTDANNAGALKFTTKAHNANQVEAMRITSSGKVLIGTGGVTGSEQLALHVNSSINFGIGIKGTSASNNAVYARFYNLSGAVAGSIQQSGSTSTTYAVSSDYRLKTDAKPMTGASARVLALKPVNFQWIADGSRVDGFLAHEAQAVVPEAVTGTKDAMMDEEYQVSAATGDIYTAGSEAGFNEVSAAIEASPAYYDVDGNIIKAEVIAEAAVHEAYDAVNEVIHSADAEQPETLEDGQQWRETTAAVLGTRSVPDMQGIDQSKMVPLLVASLQDALARITALENA